MARFFNEIEKIIKSQSNGSKEEQDKVLDALWEKKRIYVLYFLSEFGKYLVSLAKTKGGEYYRDRIDNYNVEFLRASLSYSTNPFYRLSSEEIERKLEIFESFLSLEYTPPINPIEIQEHLSMLLNYYNLFEHIKSEIPLTFTMRIDFVATQLIARALQAMPQIDAYGQELDRVRKSRKEKKSKAEKRADIAVRLFWQMEQKALKGISASKLYNNIADEIEEKIRRLSKDAQKKYPFKKRPSEKSIERYLLGDEKIKSNLKKMKIIKDKRNV